MDSLIALGSGASLVYGVYALYKIAYGFGHGNVDLVHQFSHDLYFEGAGTILTLITLGKFLEARAKGKTSDAINKLLNLAPKTATILRNGVESIIPIEELIFFTILYFKYTKRTISSSQKYIVTIITAGFLTSLHPPKRLLSGVSANGILFLRPRYRRGDCTGFAPVSLFTPAGLRPRRP